MCVAAAHAQLVSDALTRHDPFRAALDRVVFEAGKRGLRMLLALSNNWDAYGGAPAYMTWAAAAGEAIASPPAPDASPFFTSPFCKAAYKSFVATLLNRVNTYSNIAYKDDPVRSMLPRMECCTTTQQAD